HEINNPLAAVIANLDYAIVSFRTGDTGELQTSLVEAREASDRVRQIVRDLKIFSRSEDVERRGPVDVQRIMESALRMAWKQIPPGARLVKEYTPVPRVLANEARLGQVFLNLVVNAAHAISEGRVEKNEIRVQTGVAADGRVSVEVRDTGGGIAPEN